MGHCASNRARIRQPRSTEMNQMPSSNRKPIYPHWVTCPSVPTIKVSLPGWSGSTLSSHCMNFKVLFLTVCASVSRYTHWSWKKGGEGRTETHWGTVQRSRNSAEKKVSAKNMTSCVTNSNKKTTVCFTQIAPSTCLVWLPGRASKPPNTVNAWTLDFIDINVKPKSVACYACYATFEPFI